MAIQLTDISNICHYASHVALWLNNLDTSASIQKSISHIYLLDKSSRNVYNYKAVTFKDTLVLSAMCKLVCNEELQQVEIDLLKRVYIRYGWVDKTLKQLVFVPFDELVDGFVNKTLDSTDKNKFGGIMKVLSISMKDARVNHCVEGDMYKPLEVTRGKRSTRLIKAG